MKYIEQLKHPEWQKKRLKVLERAEWMCQKCYDSDTTLHVHHKFYIKGRMAWEYEDNDLIALCEDCHDEYHQWNDAFKSFLPHIPFDGGPDSLNDVCGFLSGFLSKSRAEGSADFFNDNPWLFICGAIGWEISTCPSLDINDLNKLLSGFDDVDFVFAFCNFLRGYKKEVA